MLISSPSSASSTRNVRIERMWVEVGTQFCIYWRAFFTRLERRHGLDPSKPEHLWLLHLLFLDDINADCCSFQHEWNKHPVSGRGHNMTPNDMRFLAKLQQGSLPATDHDEIDPAILSRSYGTLGPPRHPRIGQTGAGHYDDDRSSTSSDKDQDHVAAQVADDQQRHVRHPPIPVPGSTSPFSEQVEGLFLQCLHQVRTEERVPQHLGVSPAEWINGVYGDFETISFGRGGRQEEIELPFGIWWRRAVEWAQGLELMTALLIEQDG
ncbi:hypothetical protein C8T65DRAFT_590932 [Cerioporus squamosus]|nr:hypothetical protein C8T65DRAFT_590932 [Cerioporus squamosus]